MHMPLQLALVLSRPPRTTVGRWLYGTLLLLPADTDLSKQTLQMYSHFDEWLSMDLKQSNLTAWTNAYLASWAAGVGRKFDEYLQ